MKNALHQLLDSERNPWKYVWHCAVSGHNGVPCKRCGSRGLNREAGK